MMLKLKLSACAIMKDEEKNIACWLRNMQQLADEIIVVDTGSVDRTAELAREGGAEVYPFSWCDDLAAAKNFALEQATGDWILFLDASIVKYQPECTTTKISSPFMFNQYRSVCTFINRICIEI